MGSPRNWRPAFEQQTARINVDNDTWREFRTRCLANGEPVSEVIARLVRGELNRAVLTRERVDGQQAKPRKAAASPVRAEGAPETLSLFDL